MSSGISKKKRLSLQDVVDKLSLGVLEKVSEVVEIDEVTLSDEPPAVPVVQEKRRSSAHRLHLAKAFAAPSSPVASESSADDLPNSDKEIIEEELPKESGPVQPMRCGVCGFRVYKSYRYISRSSAPIHLKIFFDPDTDRFRVCKRCFSSKERCRQNLALLLLKSQTEQNVDLRSELGITQGRRTQAMKYLFRDIGHSLKRPYEDLICDETFDDDYLSDGDENIPLKVVKKEPVSTKTFSNDGEKSVGTGVVTVVRPSSNSYRTFPNHFTIYGELGQSKPIESETKPDDINDMTMIKMNNKNPEEKTHENDSEDSLPDANGELKTEIKTINYKLTLLDHAYALPAARTKPYNKPPKLVLENVPKVNKNDSIAKAAIKNMIKNNSLMKKTPSTSITENKAGQLSRTCGIVCSICDNLVTKSYSCYRKDNAPEKIKCYFTGDVKVMKVCRRCVPYKKPKGDVQPSKVTAKNKVNILQAKFLKQKIMKHLKKASKSEARSTKNEIATQTKEKISQKLTIKEEGKAKSGEKEKDLKKVESSMVHVSPKKDATVVHVSIKNGKVEGTSKSIIKTIFPPIGNSTAMINDTIKLKSTSPRMVQKFELKKPLDIKTLTREKSQTTNAVVLKLTTFTGKASEKETTDGNAGGSSVDFGTQPMHSMIGLKKAKSKTTKKDEDGEKLKTERKPTKETPEKGADANSSLEDEKKVTEDTKENENSAQTKNENESAKEKDNPIKDTDYNAKSQTEQPATNNQTEKETVRKLNVEPSNSNVEEKLSKPMSSKPLFEPVRSSPRRDKSIVPPEKTKKDLIESKSQTTKKKKEVGDAEFDSAKQPDEKANTKQIVEKSNEKQSEEKPNEKVEVAVKRSTRKGRGMKRKDSECSSTAGETSSTAGSIDGEKKEVKKARSGEAKMDYDTKSEIPNHSYSTRWAQSPIKCGCCHENVVKSYRCVQLGASPAHLKPIFTKEGKNNLRICRKCLNFPSRVKSFL